MFPGAQVTLASVSVPAYYMPLRTAGAQARKVLLDNVAAEWKVPVAELTTDKSTVIHAKSKRRISYGDVVEVRQGAGRTAEDRRRRSQEAAKTSS